MTADNTDVLDYNLMTMDELRRRANAGDQQAQQILDQAGQTAAG